MLRYLQLITAILFLGVFPAHCQNGQSVLPGSFAGWTAGGKSSFSPAQNATPDNHVASAVAKEYDFVSGEHSSYSHGTDTLDVTAYTMKDPSGAYGEYSFLPISPNILRCLMNGRSCLSATWFWIFAEQIFQNSTRS